MTKPDTVAVIGGGIGGLAAALAMLKRGLDADVYEQSASFGEVGAGISMSSNGTRVLYALGLEERLRPIQTNPLSREIRHWSTGETWNWYELGATTNQRYGAPHLMFHRGDLHGALAEAVQRLKPNAVHLAKRCIGINQTDEYVEIRFDSGEIAKVALAVGADGIHSRVRECLFGPHQAEFSRCVAWRGAVAMHHLPARLSRMITTNWLGPRGHMLHYPVRRGELMNFVGFIERDDWQVEGWAIEGTKDEISDDFCGWHPDVHAIIRAVATPLKWALMVRAPMPCWTKGRVTLLGDACHPTLPFLGQGGVMAIEDGYIIAACLRKYLADPAAAFQRYENIRRERTAAVVRMSHENRKQAFSPALVKDGEVAASVARDWQQARVEERLDWLYEYDATAVQV